MAIGNRKVIEPRNFEIATDQSVRGESDIVSLFYISESKI